MAGVPVAPSNTAPFAQTDWPIPRAVRGQYEAGQSAFAPLLLSVMPATTGWGNLSYSTTRAAFDAGRNSVLPAPTIVVVPASYAQTDWQLPLRTKIVQPYLPQRVAGPPTPPVFTPISQPDWPNPIRQSFCGFDVGRNYCLPPAKKPPAVQFGGHDLPVKRVKDRKWKEKEERQALRALIESQFEVPAVRQAIAPYTREVGSRAKPNWAQIYEHAAQIEKAIAQIQQNIDDDDEEIISLI